jgi:predicted nucleic acid-binding protein
MKYLLDSVIVIDHFNGIAAATSFMRGNWHDLSISAITRAEVLTGFDEAARVTPARLLDQLALLNINREVADLAAKLRREHRWKLPDALQAAVALQHGLILVTRNTKDFPPETLDFVVAPYRL